LLGNTQFGNAFYHSGTITVQYWNSWEELKDYAVADRTHLKSWSQYYKQLNQSGLISIWHETYVVPVENVENVFSWAPDQFMMQELGFKCPEMVEYLFENRHN
jgi:trans-aconitate methyltransferase